MLNTAFRGFILAGLAVLWSGCCESPSLGHKCLKPGMGSHECSWPEVQQEIKRGETGGTYGELGASDRSGAEELLLTSTDELSKNLGLESSLPSIREHLSMEHPVFEFVVFMGCFLVFICGLLARYSQLCSQCQAANRNVDAALQQSSDRKSMDAEGHHGQCSKSVTGDNRSHVGTDAERDSFILASHEALMEQKCARSGLSADCPPDIACETCEDAEQAELDLVSAPVCTRSSMDIVTPKRFPVDKVALTSYSVPCSDVGNAVVPDTVVPVVGATGTFRRDASDVLEQNDDSHLMQALHGSCAVAPQTSKPSEVSDQEADIFPNSRISWVSNCTEPSNMIGDDFAAGLIAGMLEEELMSPPTASPHGIGKDVTLDSIAGCSGDGFVAICDAQEVSGESREVGVVAVVSEAEPAIKKRLFVDTDATEILQCQLAEIPSPVRRRGRPSASFESPSPLRGCHPSTRLNSATPVRLHAPGTSHSDSAACTNVIVGQDDDGHDTIAAEVARNATAELFQQLLGGGASPRTLHKHSDEMSTLCDHGLAGQEPLLEVPASCQNSPAHFDESTTSVDCESVGAARDVENSLERHQSCANALDLTPSKQMKLARANSLVHSPASRPSLSAAAIDASAFSPGTSEYKEPEAGSTHRLKQLFTMEVERCQSQTNALDSTPSQQTERTRNSLVCSPASRSSMSAAIIDASAFSPGSSDYQKPEAGSTQKLKDLFEQKNMIAGNPESPCRRTPSSRGLVASTLTDFFEKRIQDIASSQHVCEQEHNRHLLRQNQN